MLYCESHAITQAITQLITQNIMQHLTAKEIHQTLIGQGVNLSLRTVQHRLTNANAQTIKEGTRNLYPPNILESVFPELSPPDPEVEVLDGEVMDLGSSLAISEPVQTPLALALNTEALDSRKSVLAKHIELQRLAGQNTDSVLGQYLAQNAQLVLMETELKKLEEENSRKMLKAEILKEIIEGGFNGGSLGK